MHEFLSALFHYVWLAYHTLGMIYESLLLIGAIGLAAQALLGFAHFGGGAHAGHSAGHAGGHSGLDLNTHHGAAPVAGHTANPCGPAAAAHGAHGTANGTPGTGTTALAHHATPTAGERASSALWTIFSPLAIFSFLLGVGAVGMLVHDYLTESWTALVALTGGVLVYAALVKPIWNLILRFASKPAETLAGAVAGEAVAMSMFDAQGKGVVRVTVDGQLVRLLAYLENDDRQRGVHICPGDALVVTSVDGAKNTCRVTRL